MDAHRCYGDNSELCDINQNSTQFDTQCEMAIHWTKELVTDGKKLYTYSGRGESRFFFSIP